MLVWLEANGGPLAIVVIGLGIGGFTSRTVGLVLIVIGVIWFAITRPAIARRLPFLPPRAQTVKPGSRLTHLEEWIQSRIEAAATLRRQRSVRGDSWFFNAMQDWDATNAWEMTFGKKGRAPELVDRYREDPRNPGQVDGTEPPHTAAARDAYYERRVSWLERTLRDLPGASSASAKADPPAANALKRLLTQGYELEGSLPPKSEAIEEDPLYQWARAAWEALREEYPQEAHDFWGHGSIDFPQLSPGYFMTAFAALTSGGNRLGYLRHRLRILERAVGQPVQPGPREKLLLNLRSHFKQGRALLARIQGAALFAALAYRAEVDVWATQAYDRLGADRPDLAAQFLACDEGFTESDPLNQIAEVGEIMAGRLCCLDQIIQTLSQ